MKPEERKFAEAQEIITGKPEPKMSLKDWIGALVTLVAFIIIFSWVATHQEYSEIYLDSSYLESETPEEACGRVMDGFRREPLSMVPKAKPDTNYLGLKSQPRTNYLGLNGKTLDEVLESR